MLRAMRADVSVGRPSASSKELVCSDCVPPSTAASASTVVRTMLLYGSCSVSDTPEVWQCVRSISDDAFFGSNSRDHPVPQQPRRAASHLHEEVHADGEEERQPTGERVDVEATGERVAARTRARRRS